MQKYLTDEEEFYSSSVNPDQKYFGPNSLRNDSDFFDEIDDKLFDSARIKIVPIGKDYIWEFMINNERVTSLKSVSFTKKEIKFLTGVDGVKYLLQCFKSNKLVVSTIKKEIKKIS